MKRILFFAVLILVLWAFFSVLTKKSCQLKCEDKFPPCNEGAPKSCPRTECKADC